MRQRCGRRETSNTPRHGNRWNEMTNDEIRMTNQIRSSNDECRNGGADGLSMMRVSSFFFRHSNLIRGFEFRHSGFAGGMPRFCHVPCSFTTIAISSF